MTPISSPSPHYSPYPRPSSRPSSRPNTPPNSDLTSTSVLSSSPNANPIGSTSLLRRSHPSLFSPPPQTTNRSHPHHQSHHTHHSQTGGHPYPTISHGISAEPTISTTTKSRQAAPYMVALSGWPEPIYVAERASEHRRSRANTPEPILSQGYTESIPTSISTSMPERRISTSSIGTAGSGKKQETIFAIPALPNRNQSQESASSPSSLASAPPENSIFHHDCPYLIPSGASVSSPELDPDIDPDLQDSTNSPAGGVRQCLCPKPFRHLHNKLPITITPTVPPSAGPSYRDTTYFKKAELSRDYPISSTRGDGPSRGSRSGGGFVDPRYAPNAAILGGSINNGKPARFLPVVPTWSDSTATATGKLSSSFTSLAKPNTSQIHSSRLTQKAVPEVYPPMMMKDDQASIATEVYPRDPNTVFLWGGREHAVIEKNQSIVKEELDGPQERDAEGIEVDK